jgi:hypothetical protein
MTTEYEAITNTSYKQPRLFRVRYVSKHNRKADVVTKVPYGGVFAMSEMLSRMLTIGQLKWFRLDVAQTPEIEAQKATRHGLERWLPALTHTSRYTGVDWTL